MAGTTGSSGRREDRARPVRVAALIVEDGRILAVRHAHPDPEKEYWVLPGGGLEPGETPAEAVRRELMEECRVEAAVDGLAFVLDQSFKKGRQLELYFNCSILGGTPVSSAELTDRSRGFENELVWATPEELAGQRFFPEELRRRFAEKGRNAFDVGAVYADDRGG